MKQTDTHYYDGSLKQLYKKFVLEDNAKNGNPPNLGETLNDMQTVLMKINVLNKPLIHKMMKVLATDQKNNYDPKNDIHVNDLLPRVWRIVKTNKEVFPAFFEQIGDISNGQCSQGRTTRIIQFIFILQKK